MMVTIFVPDLSEFSTFVQGARNSENCRVNGPFQGYWRIEAEREITFDRKTLGLGPALWNSALAGGFLGKILQYDRNTMHIVSDDTLDSSSR